MEGCAGSFPAIQPITNEWQPIVRIVALTMTKIGMIVLANHMLMWFVISTN